MKKLLAIVLSLLMVMSLAVPAMAAGEKGTITINNAVEDISYSVYKIFDLTYAGDAFTYTISSTNSWYAFVKDYQNSEGVKLFELTEVAGSATDFIVKLNPALGEVTDNNDHFVKFAQDALAEAKKVDSTITPTSGPIAADHTNTVIFSNLDLGYYLVDSTLGALCGLTSTAKDVNINEKNEEPSLDKKVQEDSTLNWDKVNNAELGQDVNYEITVTIPKNIDKDVRVVDTLTGLTLKPDTIVVKDGETVLTKDNEYTVAIVDNKEFTITFNNDFLKANVAKVNTIVITYTANVDATATIRGTGNPNEAVVEYGEGFTVSGEPSKTTTYVYDFLLKKYTGDPETLLAGAGFKLYKYDTDAITKLYATLESDPDPLKANTYKITGWDENGTEVMTDDTNRIKFVGLDADTYWLEETKVPAGYNKAEDTEVEFKQVLDNSSTAGGSDGTVDVFTADTDDIIYNTAVKIVNNSGSKLPETGGIGTTIFYVVGGLMMAVAVVLLVTKKKVNGK